MFHVEDLGTLILIRPLTDNVEEWLRENVAEDAQYFGNALVVEPRYLAALVEGLFEEGFAVQQDGPLGHQQEGS